MPVGLGLPAHWYHQADLAPVVDQSQEVVLACLRRLEWTRNVDMDELAGVCSPGTCPRLRLFRCLRLCAGRATFGRSHNISHLEARLDRGVLKFLASNEIGRASCRERW